MKRPLDDDENSSMTPEEILQKEAHIFDQQVIERINNGLIPDLRRLRKVEWFYNNVWRDPYFVMIHAIKEQSYSKSQK